MGRVSEYRRAVDDAEGGFSLVEVLTVVIVIGLLALIAIPSFLSQRDTAVEAALKSDLRNASLYQSILKQEGAPASSLSDLEEAGFRYSEGVVEFTDGDVFDDDPEPCVQGRAVGRPDHVYSLRPSDQGNPQPGACS